MHRLFIIFGSTVIQKIAVFIMMIIAARIMNIDEFGSFAFIYATSVTLTSFLGEGLATTANRYVSIKEQEDNLKICKLTGELIKCSFAVSCLLLFIFMFCSFVSVWLSKDNSVLILLKWASLIPFFTLQNTVLNAILNCFEKNITAALIGGIGSILSVVLGLFFAKSYGVVGMCVGLTIGLFFATLSYYITIHKDIVTLNVKFIDISKVYHIIKTFTVPTWGAMALGGPVHWVCLTVLATSGSEGVRNLAVFTAFFQWHVILNFIPSSVANFTIPFLVKEKGRNDRAFVHAIMKIFAANAVTGLSILLMVLLLKEQILLIYDADFAQYGNVLLLISLCGYVASFALVMSQVLWSSGKAWLNFSAAFFYAVTYIVATFVLVKFFALGAIGLGFSILISSFLQLIFQIRLFINSSELKLNGSRLMIVDNQDG